MSEYSLSITSDDYQTGPDAAPLSLIEYGDYQCPYSRLGYRYAQMALKHFGEDLRFVFRNFPIRKKHPLAQTAAEAALIAGKQGTFWEMHDTLFEENTGLEYDRILEIAEELELDLYSFKVDLSTGTFADRVQKDYRSGIIHGVDDTPTFFINEKKYPGELNYKQIRAALEAALND